MKTGRSKLWTNVLVRRFTIAKTKHSNMVDSQSEYFRENSRLPWKYLLTLLLEVVHNETLIGIGSALGLGSKLNLSQWVSHYARPGLFGAPLKDECVFSWKREGQNVRKDDSNEKDNKKSSWCSLLIVKHQTLHLHMIYINI